MDFREIAPHTCARHSSWTNARVQTRESFKNLPTPRAKSLIHFPSRLLFSTLCPERGEDAVLVVIVAITIIIFRGLEKRTTRVFRTSTGIVQVGSTRHNYAPTEWLSFFKPALPRPGRREHPHSCAPAKLRFPAAAPTTGAVAAEHPADRNPRFTLPARSYISYPRRVIISYN